MHEAGADKFVHPTVVNGGTKAHGNPIGIVRVEPPQHPVAGINIVPGGKPLRSGQQHTGQLADDLSVQLASKMPPHAHGTSGGQIVVLYSQAKYLKSSMVTVGLQQLTTFPRITWSMQPVTVPPGHMHR